MKENYKAPRPTFWTGAVLTMMMLATPGALGAIDAPPIAVDATTFMSVCDVSTEGQRECHFSCKAGSEVNASAHASSGVVAISASCGGVSVGCRANARCHDSSTAEADDLGGICSITEDGMGDDTGTGSCWAANPNDEKPDKPEPDCVIQVGPVCLQTGDPCTDELLRRVFGSSSRRSFSTSDEHRCEA